MMTICGIKNCNTMKKAFQWLNEHQVPYTFRDFKKDPLTGDEIGVWAQLVGLDTLVNRKGMTWRKLGLAGRELSEDQLIGQLLEHQTMIKRPVLIRDDQAMLVGFDEDAYASFTADGEEE